MGRNARTHEVKLPIGGGQAPLNDAQKRIAQWLGSARFRRQLLGGVSERDVWKKIGELNEMYNAALFAERARYDALLEERCPSRYAGGDARLRTDNAGGTEG
ncbi:MAG: hypothetical protein GX558_07145 [Clostridiales bacterium]|nr:hypothetical protein [Clostridiales bacterium]